MSTQTEKLGLFKYDPVADKEELFDIQTSLNDNWDKIDAAVGSFSQADWNQNDVTAPDYVKNRPGGYMDISGWEELMESREVNQFSPAGDAGVYVAEANVTYVLTSDDTKLSVTVDGNEYIGTLAEFKTTNVAHRLAPTDGEMPIGLDHYYAGHGFYMWDLYVYSSESTHIVSMNVGVLSPVPIDEKFLPDTAKAMIVTVTGNSTDGYTSDTTFAEIQTAFKAGKMVYADISSSWIPLDSVVYTRKRYMLTYLDEDLYARFRNISTIGNTVSYFGELTIDYNNIVSIDTNKNCVSKSYVDTAIETAIGAAIGGSY